MKKRLTRMTFLTAIFALMLITLYSPISQITFSTVTVTFMHIFVLIGIYIFDDWKESLFLGLFFGLISMIYAFQFPTLTRIPFQNPLISIAPRVLFAMSAYGSLQLIKRLNNKLFVILWASVSTVIHTFFVLVALNIFSERMSFVLIQSIVTLNMFPEVVLAGFVVPLVAIEVKKFIQK